MSLDCGGRNHSGALAEAADAQDTRDSIPIGPCGSGAELFETVAGTCPPTKVGRAASSAHFSSQPCDEQEIGPGIGVAHSGGGGLDGESGAPELGLIDGLNDETTGDDDVVAADWLDVTLAMLGAVEDPSVASR